MSSYLGSGEFLTENIFEKIEEEHEEFKDMLSKMEGSTNKDAETFEEFKTELTAHIKAEEQTLYESMKTDKKAKEMVLVGVEEHKMGTIVLHKLDRQRVRTGMCSLWCLSIFWRSI